jgi:hypothetical protein
MTSPTVCAILNLEYETPKEADKYANIFKNCPHVKFWGNNHTSTTIILEIPPEKTEWVEYIQKFPETTFGGIDAKLTYVKLYYPAKFNLKEFEEKEVSPCGSKCNNCVSLHHLCPGCPAVKLR